MIALTKKATHLNMGLLTLSPGFQFGFGKRWRDNLIKRSEEETMKREQSRSEAEKQDLRKGEENLTEEERQMINAYKPDTMWNLLLRQSPDHNFQKDIILHKKTFEKTIKQLRSAILFQDLLKTQIDILIYDTKGRPYAHTLLKLLYAMLTIGAVVWSFYAIRKYDPKNGVLLDRTTEGKVTKYSLYVILAIMFGLAWSRYFKFMQRYVEKIVYNTEREEFLLVKRSIWGFKSQYVASRFKILYTENSFLNKQGTNYFDIDTKEEFSIAYRDSWVKQDLFSHLISQRIKI